MIRLAEEVLTSRDAAKRRLFEAQLASWARSIELRPVYCAYLEDVLELFGESPDADPPDGPTPCATAWA